MWHQGNVVRRVNPSRRKRGRYPFYDTIEAPTIGSFKDGRGELYGTTVYKGRTVLVHGVWYDIKPNSHRYEISYSRNGGRTWVLAFKAYLTRLK